MSSHTATVMLEIKPAFTQQHAPTEAGKRLDWSYAGDRKTDALRLVVMSKHQRGLLSISLVRMCKIVFYDLD